MTDAAGHYGQAYFDWQQSIGALTAKVIRARFQPYIAPTDRVLDFGCGGGFLLQSLTCGARRGVEVNAVAREHAERNGVETAADLSGIPDGWADVIISNSALEHVDEPLTYLRRMLPKLRTGGKLVLSVPNETIASAWVPNDINQHLHSWSPMTLGNLVTVAGFAVDRVYPVKQIKPPAAKTIYALGGQRAFSIAARLYRLARLALSPIRPVDIHADVIVVAHRP